MHEVDLFPLLVFHAQCKWRIIIQGSHDVMLWTKTSSSKYWSNSFVILLFETGKQLILTTD